MCERVCIDLVLSSTVSHFFEVKQHEEVVQTDRPEHAHTWQVATQPSSHTLSLNMERREERGDMQSVSSAKHTAMSTWCRDRNHTSKDSTYGCVLSPQAKTAEILWWSIVVCECSCWNIFWAYITVLGHARISVAQTPCWSPPSFL